MLSSRLRVALLFVQMIDDVRCFCEKGLLEYCDALICELEVIDLLVVVKFDLVLFR